MPPIALVMLVLVSGCSIPAAKNALSPGDVVNRAETAQRNRPESLLSPEQRVKSPITAEWLVGYWAYSGLCDSDTETALWPDGSYTMADGRGRWSLTGSTLTMTLERRPSVEFMQVRLGDHGSSELRKIGPDEMQVEWGGGIGAGGAGGRFIRCD